MKVTKEMREIIDKWRMDNGGASFNLKTKDIILHDGGIFGISEKDIMVSKGISFKRLPGGNSQVIFSKEKVPDKEYNAIIWMSELDEIIDYFISMKQMLNQIGYDTRGLYES